MSNQCKCASSRMFPHRADKCKLSFKKTARTNPIATPSSSETETVKETSVEEVPSSVLEAVIGAESTENETGPSIVESAESAAEDSTSANEISTAEEVVDELTAAQEIAISNFSLLNGNEQCDCIAYRFKKHRKKKCSWKKHAAIALATATIVAGAAILTAVLLSDAEKDDSTDPLSSGIDNMHLHSTTQPEDEPSPDANSESQGAASPDANSASQDASSPDASGAPQDEPSSTANGNTPSTPSAAEGEQDSDSESDDEEATESAADLEARLRAEIRAEAWAAMQAERERVAAELRAERELEWQRENERQRQRAIYIHQQTQNNYQYQNVQNNYSSYSSNSYNSPTYNVTPTRSYGNSRSNVGITKSGTPCKNCLKKKSRCAQHPY